MRFTEQHLTDSAGLGAGCEAKSLLGLALPAQTNREPIGPYCARVARLASGKTAVNKRSMLTQRVNVTSGRSASGQCGVLYPDFCCETSSCAPAQCFDIWKLSMLLSLGGNDC